MGWIAEQHKCMTSGALYAKLKSAVRRDIEDAEFLALEKYGDSKDRDRPGFYEVREKKIAFEHEFTVTGAPVFADSDMGSYTFAFRYMLNREDGNLVVVDRSGPQTLPEIKPASLVITQRWDRELGVCILQIDDKPIPSMEEISREIMAPMFFLMSESE